METLIKKYKPEIQQIHDEAKTAFEEIINEANKLINFSLEKKGKRLEDLGFKKNPEVKEGKNANKARELKELIEYYNFHYPQNKFINQERVDNICTKYNLYVGSIDNYIGYVPEFALEEMENFKIKEKDKPIPTSDQLDVSAFGRQPITVQIYPTQLNVENQHADTHSFPSFSFIPIRNEIEITGYLVNPIEIIDHTINGFQIIAPEKDFLYKNKFKIGRKLIEDPIVLQPVMGGYLVVTAWGDEAKEVENPNKN